MHKYCPWSYFLAFITINHILLLISKSSCIQYPKAKIRNLVSLKIEEVNKELIQFVQYFTNRSNLFSFQFSSVQSLSRVRLCDPMNCSMPGLPVHHQLLEFTQTHIHWVGDAIQPPHPLSYPSPPAPNPSQHQSLFQWVNSLHEVAKVLEFQL